VRRNSAAALASLLGGDRILIGALQGVDAYAADAAAEALADSGALATARDRSETGTADEQDRILLAYVDGREEVPA
jgi:hypothetical protein